MKGLTSGHNELLSLVASRAAKMLAVSPRLQEHEATNEAIASALATMRSASLASVVASGVMLIQSGRDTIEGGKSAKTFLAKHKNESNASIPDDFGQELEHMAAHSTVDREAVQQAHNMGAGFEEKAAAGIGEVRGYAAEQGRLVEERGCLLCRRLGQCAVEEGRRDSEGQAAFSLQ